MQTSESDNRDSSAEQEPVRARGIEESLFSRAREWTDIFAWIRLGRVMRLAGSIITIGLVWVGLAILYLAIAFFGDSLKFSFDSPFGISVSRIDFTDCIVLLVWGQLVMTPIALLLMRQGALLVAGRTMSGTKEMVPHLRSCSVKAWLSMLVPFLCILPFAAAILLCTWIFSLFGDNAFLGWSSAVVSMALGIPCGILLFGAFFAIPLSWSAIVNEPNPDVLDGLSRGYEYTYRRPLQLILHLFISACLVAVVFYLSKFVLDLSIHIIQLASVKNENLGRLMAVATLTRLSVLITVSGGLTGGIYLLLRQDSGGKEPEDLWVGPSGPEAPLPNLRPKRSRRGLP